MGKIIATCISEKKGTLKTPVSHVEFIENFGIKGDAHAGNWHRQVSLLSLEKIEDFRTQGAKVDFGAFGENLVVSGFDLITLPVGTRLKCEDAILEVTQIGKECHSHCAIYKQTGSCIMPKQGIFAKVIKGGIIKPEDDIELLPLDSDRPFTAAVITLSDKGAAGLRKDTSGPLIRNLLKERNYAVEESLLLPDGRPQLEKELIRLSDQRQVNVIFTTGGTGFSERDLTPEATIAVCDRMAPGISEAIIMHSLNITPRAMLSRQTAGIRNKTLIVNLPGSPKACKEDLDFILPALEHGLGILRGTAKECGSEIKNERAL
ncbi:MAG: molybdenum cofactor biosynthesis protein [Treponema sp.]|nr:molybdenum cofactor biosynthesis protein [Treponema sp.]